MPEQRGDIQCNYITDEQNEDDGECLNHYVLHFQSTNSDPLLGDCNIPLMKVALKFTYENYHSRCWYWEVVEMTRKLLMTTGIVLFVGHTKIGLSCTIIAAMVFPILHASVKPFKSDFESGAQFLSLILVPLNLAFGALLQSQDNARPSFINKKRDSFFLGWFLVAMNLFMICILIVRIIIITAKRIGSRRQPF